MKVRMRATFDEVWWDPDVEDGEPNREGGYTDPNNPWGGLDCIPDERNAPPWTTESSADMSVRHADWDAYLDAEGVDTITFETLWDAAEFVLEFPGGVWDYHEGPSELISASGRYRSVTLHVQDHDVAVFALADTIAGMNERVKLRNNARRRLAAQGVTNP